MLVKLRGGLQKVSKAVKEFCATNELEERDFTGECLERRRRFMAKFAVMKRKALNVNTGEKHSSLRLKHQYQWNGAK